MGSCRLAQCAYSRNEERADHLPSLDCCSVAGLMQAVHAHFQSALISCALAADALPRTLHQRAFRPASPPPPGASEGPDPRLAVGGFCPVALALGAVPGPDLSAGGRTGADAGGCRGSPLASGLHQSSCGHSPGACFRSCPELYFLSTRQLPSTTWNAEPGGC